MHLLHLNPLSFPLLLSLPISLSTPLQHIHACLATLRHYTQHFNQYCKNDITNHRWKSHPQGTSSGSTGQHRIATRVESNPSSCQQMGRPPLTKLTSNAPPEPSAPRHELRSANERHIATRVDQKGGSAHEAQAAVGMQLGAGRYSNRASPWVYISQ